MNDNVIYPKLITKLDLPPDRLLKAAMGKLSEVVILGFDIDGNDYYASSKADAMNTIFHCERVKYKLMQIIDEMTE